MRLNQIDALQVVVRIACEAFDGSGRLSFRQENLRPSEAGVNDGNGRHYVLQFIDLFHLRLHLHRFGNLIGTDAAHQLVKNESKERFTGLGTSS
jgi:hypothetical protein